MGLESPIIHYKKFEICTKGVCDKKLFVVFYSINVCLAYVFDFHTPGVYVFICILVSSLFFVRTG